MSSEDYAMSMMDEDEKKEMDSDKDEMDMPSEELPVNDIMDKLGDMNLSESQMSIIEKHLMMADKEMY